MDSGNQCLKPVVGELAGPIIHCLLRVCKSIAYCDLNYFWCFRSMMTVVMCVNWRRLFEQ